MIVVDNDGAMRDVEWLVRADRGLSVTSASHCEAPCTIIDAHWLARLERQLEGGDPCRVLRRLGRWVAADARPLGEAAVRTIALAARAVGREDVARAHLLGLGLLAGERADRREHPHEDRALVVGPSCRWLEVEGRTLSLSRRPSLRRLLAALVEHPRGLEPGELAHAAWSDPAGLRTDAHTRETQEPVNLNRLNVSLARLRAMGLRDHILRRDGRIVLVGPIVRGAERPVTKSQVSS